MDKKKIEILDDLKSSIEEARVEESKLVKGLKRVYILVIVLIIVTLLLMSTNAGYYILDFYSSNIASSKLTNDYAFEFNNGVVHFEPDVYEDLLKIYYQNQEHEIKVCLIGYIATRQNNDTALQNNKIFMKNESNVNELDCLNNEKNCYKEELDYYVIGLYIPKITKQEVYSVRAEICNQETIVSLHSHPPLRCIFSDQDQQSFEYFKSINPDAIYGLMCDKDRMSFMS
jgi:proteasome lid subunit RPN8/RPN11